MTENSGYLDKPDSIIGGYIYKKNKSNKIRSSKSRSSKSRSSKSRSLKSRFKDNTSKKNKDSRNFKNYKYKGGKYSNRDEYKGGGLIPTDVKNLFGEINFNFKSLSNSLGGYNAPVNPSVYKDQLLRTRSI